MGKRSLVACGTVVLMVWGVTAAVSADSVGPNNRDQVATSQVDDHGKVSGVNIHGDTYGIAPLNRSQTSPDLVAVVGDEGVEGYVYSAELFDDPNDNPATPEEALAIQANAEDRVLPVFTVDGRTQVDTFTVWGPNHDMPMPEMP